MGLFSHDSRRAAHDSWRLRSGYLQTFAASPAPPGHEVSGLWECAGSIRLFGVVSGPPAEFIRRRLRVARTLHVRAGLLAPDARTASSHAPTHYGSKVLSIRRVRPM